MGQVVHVFQFWGTYVLAWRDHIYRKKYALDVIIQDFHNKRKYFFIHIQ